MSSHTNLNSKKCWSCIYYGGKRRLSRLITLSVESDDKGTCMCNKCSYFGKEVSQSNSCCKWQIDKITFDAQREIEQKKIDKQNKELEQRCKNEAREVQSETFRQRLINDDVTIFDEKFDEERYRQENAKFKFKNGQIWKLNIPEMHAAYKYAKEFPDDPLSKKINKWKKIWYGIWIIFLLFFIFLLLLLSLCFFL